MADYTTSEHARLLLAEAMLLLRDETEDRSESLFDAIALAVDQADVPSLIASLACSAAEAWARFGKTLDLTGIDTLQVVLQNWAEADQAVAAALTMGD